MKARLLPEEQDMLSSVMWWVTHDEALLEQVARSVCESNRGDTTVAQMRDALHEIARKVSL